MRHLAFAVLFCLGAGVIPSNFANAQQELPKRLTAFEGKCRFQRVDKILPCEPKLLFVELRNGRAFITIFAEGYSWTLSGAGDRQPNLENYYQSIDTVRLMEGRERKSEDKGMEGECHFSLNAQATKFYSITCDVYNRAKGSTFKVYFEDITKFDRTDL